ncbi:MAG: hypothetical protein P8Z77_16070 [Candidatus Thiodiazotropha sp.]
MKRTPEVRVNGCGFKYLGIRQVEETITGTYWFTFLFFPILPILRATISYPQPKTVLVSKPESLRFGEVMKTYLFGWIIFPLLLLAPLLLGVALIALLQNGMAGLAITFAGVVWAGVGVWKMADWDDRRRKKLT